MRDFFLSGKMFADALLLDALAKEAEQAALRAKQTERVITYELECRAQTAEQCRTLCEFYPCDDPIG